MTHAARMLLLTCLVASLPACRSEQKAEYAKPLPPGAYALRKLDPADWPDLSRVAAMDDAFIAALKRSLAWFDKPSSRQFYPSNGITHRQAQATLFALPNLAWQAQDADAFIAKLKQECDLYTSVGWDDRGTVLFTGYFTPILPASRVRTARFQHPLYTRPADLIADSTTGEVKGRRVGNTIEPYPPRRVIEQTNMLAGTELVWLESRLDAYLVEVQGSAKLTMTDGSTMLVGYAGSNGGDYTSLRQLLVDDGKLDKDTANLPAIKAYFRDYPQELDGYIRRNDRFIFFAQYTDASQWPAGSLGVKVEPMRSLATDKSVFPRGCVCLVMTTRGDGPVEDEPRATRGLFSFLRTTRDEPAAPQDGFQQWMLDQDTGGAIRAAGRADMYFGLGPAAEQQAGRQIAEGRLYYLFVKPQRVDYWLQRSKQVASP